MNILFDTYLGETMALSTAITWALAVILFKKSGEHVHPIALNLFKGVMAILLLIPTIYFVGEELFYGRPLTDYLLVMASGAIGIGIADTLFFKSLNLLGASLSAVVDCLYSPFVIALSLLWIDESMTLVQFIGAAMIVSAVLSTMAERRNGAISRPELFKGLVYGVVAMALMAIGIVMIKPLLNGAPLFWVTEWRIVGGILILGLLLLANPRRQAILKTLATTAHRKQTIAGSFIGGYIAMILWLGGMKYIQASTAAVLNQTSNIWIFIFAGIFLKERITLIRLIAILLGVGGVYLISLG